MDNSKITLISSPHLGFVKLCASCDKNTKDNLGKIYEWYGKDAEIQVFYTPRRKAVKQMFQREFMICMLGPNKTMFDKNYLQKYIDFLNIVTSTMDCDRTKDFKIKAYKRIQKEWCSC